MNGKNDEEWFQEGLNLMKSFQYPEAVVAFNEALKVNNKHVEALFNKGTALGLLQLFEEAVSAYDELLTINGEHAKGLEGKAMCLDNMDSFEEALKAYDRVLVDDSQNASVWRRKAKIFYKMKQYKEMIASFRKAIEMTPITETELFGDTPKRKSIINEALLIYGELITLRTKVYISEGTDQSKLDEVIYELKTLAEEELEKIK